MSVEHIHVQGADGTRYVISAVRSRINTGGLDAPSSAQGLSEYRLNGVPIRRDGTRGFLHPDSGELLTLVE